MCGGEATRDEITNMDYAIEERSLEQVIIAMNESGAYNEHLQDLECASGSTDDLGRVRLLLELWESVHWRLLEGDTGPCCECSGPVDVHDVCVSFTFQRFLQEGGELAILHTLVGSEAWGEPQLQAWTLRLAALVASHRNRFDRQDPLFCRAVAPETPDAAQIHSFPEPPKSVIAVPKLSGEQVRKKRRARRAILTKRPTKACSEEVRQDHTVSPVFLHFGNLCRKESTPR